MYLFFPGRHLLTTKFQEEYLWKILKENEINNKITDIIFAVTSSNQENSRYNPLAFYLRALGLDRFSREFSEKLGVKNYIVPIPHLQNSTKFEEYILKETHEHSNGLLNLNPSNTLVLCSTVNIIERFEKLGFRILPAEFDRNTKKYIAKTPIEILKKVVEVGDDWLTNKEILDELSDATKKLWQDYPEIPDKIMRIWKDPLLTESGSLTETRDYSSYAYGMGKGDVIDYKYNDMSNFILPGKIADEGCADGSLIIRLAKDYPDSDIIGIEITSEFIARCKERQRAGEFGGTFVHVHQRNLMNKIFEDDSINTTLCNSTTHELWSYGDKDISLNQYLLMKYKQICENGRLIIRDVVGPEDKETEIHLWLNHDDGVNDDVYKKCDDTVTLGKHLASLSTYSRFLRFAEDFLSDMRTSGKRGADSKINFQTKEIEGQRYVVIKLKDAVEFFMKKDYVDNWRSELNEEFAFWSFSEWKKALSDAGFAVIENPNNLIKSSRDYVNPWIIENRLKGKVELFKMEDGKLNALPYPVNNMILVGEKLSS